MKLSTLFKIFLTIFLVFVGILLAFGETNYLLYQDYLGYLERDAAARPLYVQLNEAVLKQVPVPEGAIEFEHSSSYGHGSILEVRYKFTNASMDVIFSHYERFFTSMGWSRKLDFTDTKIYTKNTSCFKLRYYGVPDQYLVSIEHDYFKQAFTPKMPPKWFIEYHEAWETSFSGCPEYH